MGKRAVRVIAVSKGTSRVLLAALTLLMAILVWALSGHAYASEEHRLGEVLIQLADPAGWPSRDSVLAALMPAAANALLFLPWGFLAFMTLDSPARPRRATYALCVAGALAFAGGMYVWQQFLPTRVTSLGDAVANAIGALAGATLGQARRDLRVWFEI